MSFDMPPDEPIDREEYEAWEREQALRPAPSAEPLPSDTVPVPGVPGYKSTLTEADPVGSYEATDKESGKREVRYWDGAHFCPTSPSIAHIRDVFDYTDFHGPLTVPPEGWEEVVEAAREASDHVDDLVDAWMRGCIHETDGKGGTRSNRNWNVASRLRAALAKLAPAEPTDAPREK